MLRHRAHDKVKNNKRHSDVILKRIQYPGHLHNGFLQKSQINPNIVTGLVCHHMGIIENPGDPQSLLVIQQIKVKLIWQG